MTNRSVKISKFLSLVLRHQPETIGITLSGEGWVRVDDLLAAMNSHSFSVSLEELQLVVQTNDKLHRFSRCRRMSWQSKKFCPQELA